LNLIPQCEHAVQPASPLYFITLIVGTVMAAVLATFAWSRRGTPGAVPFALAMLFVMLASASRIVFSIAPETHLYTLARLRLVALGFVPPFALIFVLAYVGHRRWAQPSRAWILLVVPLVLGIGFWTHDQLFWTDWHVSDVGGARNEVMQYGPLWRVNLLYAYGCFIVTFGLLLRALLTAIRPLRSQTMLLIVGWGIVVLSNMPFAIASLGRVVPNLTNLGFVIGGCFFLTALRRQGFLDRIPMALQTVYQQMQDGVAVFDAKRRVVALNPTAERFFGCESAHAVGRPAEQILGRQSGLLADIDGLPGARNTEVVHDDRVYDFSSSPILSEGEPNGHILVIRDITSRKMAEQRSLELALEHERVRLMAAIIRDTSQELRAPLTSINAALFQAQRTTSAHERRDRLAQIEESTAHMTQMIDSLQLLADLDMRTQLSLSEFTVRDWLETLPNAVRELIDRRGHRLLRDFDRDNPIGIHGDFYLLRAALQQLIHNAALYTPAGGTIVVKALRRDGNVEVTVSDTGVGIALDALDAIFLRFTKLHNTHGGGADGSGAGVGLSIVKKVVELHGGSVSAASTPGKGSAFTIRLPLKAVASPGLEQRAAS
jgi:PAS domain S-box-containing protein